MCVLIYNIEMMLLINVINYRKSCVEQKNTQRPRMHNAKTIKPSFLDSNDTFRFIAVCISFLLAIFKMFLTLSFVFLSMSIF